VTPECHVAVPSNESIEQFLRSLDAEKEYFHFDPALARGTLTAAGHYAGDSLAGVAGVRRHCGFPVLYVVVRQDYQGRGIGRLLMERLHEQCRKRHRLIVLTVEKANERAVALYRSMGYATLGCGQSELYMALCFDALGGVAARLLRVLLWSSGKCR